MEKTPAIEFMEKLNNFNDKLAEFKDLLITNEFTNDEVESKLRELKELGSFLETPQPS